MEDFIDRAKARESKELAGKDETKSTGGDTVERLRLAFPHWLDSLITALEQVCSKLAAAYPGITDRHYAVLRTSTGCSARCQSQAELDLDLDFSIDLQTVTVQHFGLWTDAPLAEYLGKLGITVNSEVFVEYMPHFASVSHDLWVSQRYTSTELFANDLMQELTRL